MGRGRAFSDGKSWCPLGFDLAGKVRELLVTLNRIKNQSFRHSFFFSTFGTEAREVLGISGL